MCTVGIEWGDVTRLGSGWDPSMDSQGRESVRGANCYYCFKKIIIFLLQIILYNSHPGTAMPNTSHFSDVTTSISIKSTTFIFLNIFPILFFSKKSTFDSFILNICSRHTRPFSARLPLSRALGEGSRKAGGRTEKYE